MESSHGHVQAQSKYIIGPAEDTAEDAPSPLRFASAVGHGAVMQGSGVGGSCSSGSRQDSKR